MTFDAPAPVQPAGPEAGGKDPSLAGVITHLHALRERKNISLSRALHDDLGGHLVSAVMDLGWVEQHLKSPEDIQLRLGRVRQALSAAIDLKRNLIEELRPSLLDNFGLFAAYRWHVKHTCQRAAVACRESYPANEPSFTPEALTGLFRIMQETLELIVAEDALKIVDVRVDIDPDMLSLDIMHEHEEIELIDMLEHNPAQMNAIAHRITLLQGQLSVQRQPLCTVISTRFPLKILIAA